MPLLSIIIPIYNVENYIEQCVDSVLNQSYKDFELILINDGSTDNSGYIIDLYEKNDVRVKVIHKNNGGASSARNVGLKAASGDYVYFVDSDDFLSDLRMFEKIRLIIQKDDNVEIIKTKQKAFKDGTDNYFNVYNYKDIDIINGLNGISAMLKLCKTNQFVVSVYSYIIKRELLIRNNLYFIEGIYSEDIDWTPRVLLKAKRIRTLNEFCYCRRQERPGQITYKTNLKRDLDCAKVIDKWFKKKNQLEMLESQDESSYFWNYLSNIFIGLVGNNYLYPNEEAKERRDLLSEYSYIIKYNTTGRKSYLALINSLFGFKAYTNTIATIKQLYRLIKA